MTLDTAHNLDPISLDYSMFSRTDLMNLVLQRSEVIEGPRPGRLIKAWIAGDAEPLRDYVEQMGQDIARMAAKVILAEFEALTPLLDKIGPKRLADIGCGYGFFDLFCYHRYGNHVLLIDVESNDNRHFGFHEEAAAYTSLNTAQAFLRANAVPVDKIATWNPDTEDPPEDDKVDLAVSFLSCGYHFPVDMYLPFFRYGVKPNGRLILDIRGQSFQDAKQVLKAYGSVNVLTQGGGRKRVLVEKGARR